MLLRVYVLLRHLTSSGVCAWSVQCAGTGVDGGHVYSVCWCSMNAGKISEIII